MTPSARRGKGAPVDPFSAFTLAESVVTILATLGTPIVGFFKSRRVKGHVRKAIERASSNFVAEHPETADAMATSAEAIAQELAQLRGGRPLAATRVAEHWVSGGYFELSDARAYAEQYARALHNELLKIEGFRDLFEAGITITTAETVLLIDDGLERDRAAARAREEREVAVLHFEAAREYFGAALALLDGDKFRAMGLAHNAETHIDTARLHRDSLALVRSKDVRERFAGLVEDRYEDVEAACAEGDRAKADAAVAALNQGCREFRAFVTARLSEI